MVGFAVFIHSIVGIELTLHWNQISDVYTIRSLGQLIPFVIAVVEFARFAFKLAKKVGESIRNGDAANSFQWRKRRGSSQTVNTADVENIAAVTKLPDPIPMGASVDSEATNNFRILGTRPLNP